MRIQSKKAVISMLLAGISTSMTVKLGLSVAGSAALTFEALMTCPLYVPLNSVSSDSVGSMNSQAPVAYQGLFDYLTDGVSIKSYCNNPEQQLEGAFQFPTDDKKFNPEEIANGCQSMNQIFLSLMETKDLMCAMQSGTGAPRPTTTRTTTSTTTNLALKCPLRKTLLDADPTSVNWFVQPSALAVYPPLLTYYANVANFTDKMRTYCKRLVTFVSTNPLPNSTSYDISAIQNDPSCQAASAELLASAELGSLTCVDFEYTAPATLSTPTVSIAPSDPCPLYKTVTDVDPTASSWFFAPTNPIAYPTALTYFNLTVTTAVQGYCGQFESFISVNPVPSDTTYDKTSVSNNAQCQTFSTKLIQTANSGDLICFNFQSPSLAKSLTTTTVITTTLAPTTPEPTTTTVTTTLEPTTTTVTTLAPTTTTVAPTTPAPTTTTVTTTLAPTTTTVAPTTPAPTTTTVTTTLEPTTTTVTTTLAPTTRQLSPVYPLSALPTLAPIKPVMITTLPSTTLKQQVLPTLAPVTPVMITTLASTPKPTTITTTTSSTSTTTLKPTTITTTTSSTSTTTLKPTTITTVTTTLAPTTRQLSPVYPLSALSTLAPIKPAMITTLPSTTLNPTTPKPTTITTTTSSTSTTTLKPTTITTTLKLITTTATTTQCTVFGYFFGSCQPATILPTTTTTTTSTQSIINSNRCPFRRIFKHVFWHDYCRRHGFRIYYDVVIHSDKPIIHPNLFSYFNSSTQQAMKNYCDHSKNLELKFDADDNAIFLRYIPKNPGISTLEQYPTCKRIFNRFLNLLRRNRLQCVTNIVPYNMRSSLELNYNEHHSIIRKHHKEAPSSPYSIVIDANAQPVPEAR